MVGRKGILWYREERNFMVQGGKELYGTNAVYRSRPLFM
jgi:hypothetical protein